MPCFDELFSTSPSGRVIQRTKRVRFARPSYLFAKSEATGRIVLFRRTSDNQYIAPGEASRGPFSFGFIDLDTTNYRLNGGNWDGGALIDRGAYGRWPLYECALINGLPPGGLFNFQLFAGPL